MIAQQTGELHPTLFLHKSLHLRKISHFQRRGDFFVVAPCGILMRSQIVHASNYPAQDYTKHNPYISSVKFGLFLVIRSRVLLCG